MRIGIAGLGTVGAGVLHLLDRNADLIAARAGQPITVAAVSARDRSRDRGVKLDGVEWVDNPQHLATMPGIDVVVELIGGADGPARELVTASLTHGRPVVTANKALIAVHGETLPRTAALAFEAAVAGGIPVIKALREGLAANQITRVAGILNGTCNYILTAMREQKRDFADVLAEAQALGYAEADPATDIDGIDAAHKLAILAALAFGHPVRFDSVYVEGIRRISALDIASAEELGYRIKLLGIARRTAAGVEARVHPCLVSVTAPIARVDGVFNAVVAEGDAVGRMMLEGRGAGAGPTASAVVADLIDLARGRFTPTWGQETPSDFAVVPIGDHVGPYYLRLMVTDRPGVIADVAAILRDHGVSLESLLQHGRNPGEPVAVVLVTHEVREQAMRAALDAIAALDAVLEPPALIRIEPG
ncbi:homoserine dehydrogenase [Acidisphaera sp. L21]|uniref:homoserine dehydrogenase n=1 Tax=Acidisphaera sp. L21 TaxID=1641851 RepID=UPI00131DCD7C|nr:homoserine dehydrogenase [Acidisphaera sp. L21]